MIFKIAPENRMTQNLNEQGGGWGEAKSHGKLLSLIWSVYIPNG